MPLPSSGEIKVSQINTELSRTSNTANSNFAGGTTPQTGSLFKLGEARSVNQTAPHKMSEWYEYPDLFPCDLDFTHQYGSFGEVHGYEDPNGLSLDQTDPDYEYHSYPVYGALLYTINSGLNDLEVNSNSAVDDNTIVYLGAFFDSSQTNPWRLEFLLEGDSSEITTWDYIDITFTPTYTDNISHLGFRDPNSTYTKWEITEETNRQHYDDSVTGIVSGMTVTGSGVPANTTISAATVRKNILSTFYYEITLSNACYISNNTNLTFTSPSAVTTTVSRSNASFFGFTAIENKNGDHKNWGLYTWFLSSNPFGIGSPTRGSQTQGKINVYS